MAEKSTAEALEQARAAARGGDLEGAFAALERALGYPDGPSDDALGGALEVTAEVLGDAFPEASKAVAAAAAAPEDVDALYDAGYALVENDLVSWAATLLSRAHALAPDEERVLNELATALELQGLHRGAVKLLAERSEALADRFMPRYLHAFISALAGDAAPAREGAAWLREHASTEAQRFMAARVTGIARRAEALVGVTPLDGDDVRGWIGALGGGLVLERGESEGRGRFTALDGPSAARAAIAQVGALLERLGVEVPRVIVLDDAPSRALGLATAEVLGLPHASLRDEPGLVVAWDVSGAMPGDQQALRTHRPGQILWSHALQFTRTHRSMPDVVTGLVRRPKPPIARGEDPGPLAQRIAGAEARPVDEQALAIVVAIAEATRDLGADAAGVFRGEGDRPKAWPWGVTRD